MSNQNKSRNQGNQRGLRTSDPRGIKSSVHQARPSNGVSENANNRMGPSNGAYTNVEQLAHQATDLASNAAKATTEAVTRATRATGEAIGKTSDAALEMVRANPIPLALAGIGVACTGIGISWLIVSRRPGASAKVSDLAHRAGAQATQVEQQLEALIKEHPIAAGAALLGVGAAIGFAVPHTALEDTWIGHERDRLMKGARNLVEGVMEKGKALVEQVMPDSATAEAHA